MFEEEYESFDVLSILCELVEVNQHIQNYEDDELVDQVVALQTYFDFSKMTDKIIKNFFSVSKLSKGERKILESALILVMGQLSYDNSKGQIVQHVVRKT